MNEKTFIPAVSAAALYGQGVFTTLAIFDGKPFLWEKHWHRLRENAGRIGVDLTQFSEEAVKNTLFDAIKKNKIEKGRARLTFFDERPGKIWLSATENKTSLLITTADFRPLKDVFRLTLSPFPVNSKSPLVGVKSCNYLEHLLAFEEIRQRGFDEAVRLNEKNELVSAAMANLFWVKDGKIFTPHLETGSLNGTTRAFLLENFTVTEVKTGLKQLIEADEIFLSSAGLGIQSAIFENQTNSGFSIISSLKDFYKKQFEI